MQVVTDNEAPTRIRPGQSHEIGRAHGVNASDKTISRRHLSLSVAGAMNSEEGRLQFEVLGRNPIYVYRNDEVKIFRRFERGEMGNGDMFCISGKNPVWYSVRRTEDGAEGVRPNVAESELAGKVESDFEFKGVDDLDQLDLAVDISGLDPVKEFGFVVEGHEFDSYPKKMMRDIKNWDWFTKEEGRNGEDDDEGKKMKGKRKRGGENDDDEWSGESEDEKVLMEKSRKVGKAKYVTRSKDRGKQSKVSSTRTENRDVDDEDDGDDDEDGDEDDETLGGFVVDDQNLDEEGDELEEEEEEEEDFEDEDEDE